MAQLIPPKAPALPLASDKYSSSEQERTNGILRRYFNVIDAAFQQLFRGFNNYGIFIDTTTHSPAAPNTAYPITINTTVEAFGISLDAGVPSHVKISQGGVYSVQAALHMGTTGGSGISIYTWLRRNGSDVANSGMYTATGPGDQEIVIFARTMTLNSGDYFELVWASNSTSASLYSLAAAAPVPATPSVVLTVSYLFPTATT